MLQCTTRSNTSTPSSMIPVGRAGSASPIYVSCPSKNAHHHGQCQCVTASHLMIDSSTTKKRKKKIAHATGTQMANPALHFGTIYTYFFFLPQAISYCTTTGSIRPSAESITQPRKIQICWSRWDTHDILCII